MAGLLHPLLFFFSIACAAGMHNLMMIPAQARLLGGSERALLADEVPVPVQTLPPLVIISTNSDGSINCIDSTHIGNTSTIFVIEVPGGTYSVADLQVAPLAAGYPKPVSKQTFEVEPVTNLPVLGLQDTDVFFRFRSSLTGKCWDDNDGETGARLRQVECAFNLGDVVNPNQLALAQLFQVIALRAVEGCSSTDTTKVFQIRSFASFRASLASGNLQTCLSAYPGFGPAFYPCDSTGGQVITFHPRAT